MERVVEAGNLRKALKQVMANRGAPGIDGMTVKELPPYLWKEWPRIRKELLRGRYRPQPVLRKAIPKEGGGVRKLGVPTVLDRFIQQAVLHVLQPEWDATFSNGSYGFRPGRNAHQAIGQAQRHLHNGYTWVVDMDLEKFFDRVDHEKLMSEVARREKDSRVLGLIHSYLRSGVVEDDTLHEGEQGTPQGGPLSPLLANLLLDRLDRELEKRGHRFVRYADDCNVYVRSRRAGLELLRKLTRYLARQLKLSVNEAKSAVDRPWNRKFLGFSFTRRRRRSVSIEAQRRFKERVRALTQRTRGRSLKRIVGELREYFRGWIGYFGYAEVQAAFRMLDQWARRRLRCYSWKQWGQRRYRNLVKLGVSRDLAWNTRKSAHGPWRLSLSPALCIALPGRYFDAMGLPRLSAD